MRTEQRETKNNFSPDVRISTCTLWCESGWEGNSRIPCHQQVNPHAFTHSEKIR